MPGSFDGSLEMFLGNVQADERGRVSGELDEALASGDRFVLELRRPEAAARLLIKPTLQIAEGHRPLGAWEWDRWV